jgi:hypothetical protein
VALRVLLEADEDEVDEGPDTPNGTKPLRFVSVSRPLGTGRSQRQHSAHPAYLLISGSWVRAPPPEQRKWNPCYGRGSVLLAPHSSPGQWPGVPSPCPRIGDHPVTAKISVTVCGRERGTASQ